MSELAARIRNVRSRVEGLLKERDRLSASNTSMDEELREARRNGGVLQARIAELERENEVLRTVRTAPTSLHRAGSKERIDELVSEIDRCLALLHN